MVRSYFKGVALIKRHFVVAFLSFIGFGVGLGFVKADSEAVLFAGRIWGLSSIP
jgi:hypothetical protein